MADSSGPLMHAVVRTAGIQDRDGGVMALPTMFGLYPFLEKVFADGGYQGPKLRAALKKTLPDLSVDTVKRHDRAQGFEPLPERWVVERTIGGPNRCRRLSKDFECSARRQPR